MTHDDVLCYKPFREVGGLSLILAPTPPISLPPPPGEADATVM